MTHCDVVDVLLDADNEAVPYPGKGLGDVGEVEVGLEEGKRETDTMKGESERGRGVDRERRTCIRWEGVQWL